MYMSNALTQIKLKNLLLDYVQLNPGTPAKIIARDLCGKEGVSVSKKDINPILYRERSIFRPDGYTPPIWYRLDQIPKVVPKREAKQTEKSLKVRKIIPKEKVKYEEINIVYPELKKKIDELYTWQYDALKKWQEDNYCGVIQAVTGTGKTKVALNAVRAFIKVKRDLRILILVPSVVLLEQWKEAIWKDLGFEITSMLGGGYGNIPDLTSPITIGVVNTVSSMAEDYNEYFDVLIADECHRYAAKSFSKALFTHANYRMGLTATLERSDEGVKNVLLPYFTGISKDYDYEQAKKDKVIAPYGVACIGVKLLDEEQENYDISGNIMQKTFYLLTKKYGYPKSFGEFIAKANQAYNQGGEERDLTQKYLSALQKRKKILSGSQSKLDTLWYVADAISASTSSLVFCENIESAETISTQLNEIHIEYDENYVSSVPYHSGMK
ncbi:MAG TPA: DEAD/DEAH box helicase, partial [Sulfurimonas sp.]|nr:DEAD/DEAH box helicase [Sulfurimonas sp.]